MGKPRAFTYSEENLTEIAFPLGGLGAGCVSLEGRGSLRDWEIYGRPNKGGLFSFTFPVLWWREEGTEGPRDQGTKDQRIRGSEDQRESEGIEGNQVGIDDLQLTIDDSSEAQSSPNSSIENPKSKIQNPHDLHPPTPSSSGTGGGGCLVLHGPRHKNFQGEGPGFWDWGHGQFFRHGDGLPCFDATTFKGTFPTCEIRFEKKGLPLEVTLKAFSPFVPKNQRDSGFPIAVLRYVIKNTGTKPVDLTLVWTLFNPVGEGHPATQARPDKATASFKEEGKARGILFTNDKFKKGEIEYGTAAITTDWPTVTYTERWLDTGWWDGLQNFWERLSSTGELEPGARKDPGSRVAGSLGLKASLKPGETVELPVAISWCFPTTTRYWGGPGAAPTWTPYYATQWPDAWAAAKEFWERREELTSKTERFAENFHRQKLPEELIESVSATLSTFHTPTCLRLEDGTFWAWEGCSPKDGCCAGTCAHVWNYATAHAWLFPEIAHSIRHSEYAYGFNCGPEGAKGAINFRIPIPLKAESSLWHAASDGQLGGIMQLYRDWQLSGSDEILRVLWPGAKKALEYAWAAWDKDQDGLVEGEIMHNTYDINFAGPNPLTQFMYLGALKAASVMARRMGEAESANHYDYLYKKGREKAEKELWNGEYFIQTNDCLKPDAPKYQHGIGCLSDQLFGALCARVAGLGEIVDPAKEKSALKAIFKYNFKDPLGDHENLQRVYAFKDEAGLILCTWPRGGRPRFPFVYSDEVWTGIEYQVAAHMAFVGLKEESLKILKAIRSRYDGRRRNPFNEFECGSHYARALASWSVYLGFGGKAEFAE